MSKSGNTWFKIKRAKLAKQNQASERRYMVQVPGPDYTEIPPAVAPKYTVLEAGTRTPYGWNKRAGMYKHEKYAPLKSGFIRSTVYRRIDGKLVAIG